MPLLLEVINKQSIIGKEKRCFFLFFFFCLMAVLGLHRFVWALSSCGAWGLFFVVAHGHLTVVAPLVAEHRQASVVAALRLGSCGSRFLAYTLRGCGAQA